MSLPNGNQARHTGATGLPLPALGGGPFDIFIWHPAYKSCQRYFVDHAQHDSGVQAVAALINILLPYQWHTHSVKGTAFSETVQNGSYTNFGPAPPSTDQQDHNSVSLVPYIRRLVVTGFDREPLLHGFFGDDWRTGTGPIQECERRNYLFAAKSGGWASVKSQYDHGPHETVPFLRPPQEVHLAEIEAAEKQWSQWLATEDWMIGPRAPEDEISNVRRHEDQGRPF
ncbi:MAG: hypothetical protein M1828_004223 [Chrysothrix sp. TS-e1954]|nr:MAG: hypothetical protein M1828_004223 [Chrysothrix sp. TS-e1954]